MTPIEVRTPTLEDLRACAPDILTGRALLLLSSAPAWTGFVGDRIVFVAGIISPWPGVGEAWNIPGPYFRDYLEAPRTLRRLLREAVIDCGYRRVQTTVTNETSRRFDAWLGFEEESRLPEYGPEGQDGIIMRLKSWE